jgi:ABC-type multidrug transport system ATPase subunit
MVIINKGQTIIEGSVAELMNAQETLLHIELAQNSQGAATLIHEILPAVKIQVSSPKTLELNVEKQHIALLNSKLVQAGYEVVALEPKRKLEDFFIQMTQT